jgi:hypothetical protein
VEAFIGISSVRNLVVAIAQAGILPDLILVAVIFALAIVPLGQFSRIRPSLHRVRPSTPPPVLGLHA